MIHGDAARGSLQATIARKVGITQQGVSYVLRRDRAVVAAHGRILLLRRRVARFFRPHKRTCTLPTHSPTGSARDPAEVPVDWRAVAIIDRVMAGSPAPKQVLALQRMDQLVAELAVARGMDRACAHSGPVSRLPGRGGAWIPLAPGRSSLGTALRR